MPLAVFFGDCSLWCDDLGLSADGLKTGPKDLTWSPPISEYHPQGIYHHHNGVNNEVILGCHLNELFHIRHGGRRDNAL